MNSGKNGNHGGREFWADGGCLFQDGSGRERLAYGSFFDGESIRRFNFSDARTSNEAEYRTLIALLASLADCSAPIVYTDSKLMVGQLTRRWKVKATNLKPLHKFAKELMHLKRATLRWIPRERIVARLGH